jgi:hypothetical protein
MMASMTNRKPDELARRTMASMHELSKNRLGKIKRQRSKDGLSYQERRLVLKADVELPDEVSKENMDADDSPTKDGGAGE